MKTEAFDALRSLFTCSRNHRSLVLAREAAGGFGNSAKQMTDCIAAAESAEGTPYARSADAPLSMQSDVNSINSKKRGEKSESNLTAGR